MFFLPWVEASFPHFNLFYLPCTLCWKSSLRSWIKRFPQSLAAGAGHTNTWGGSAQFQQQLPSKLPLSCPSLLLLKFFFPSLDERTLPQYKRRSLSGSQQDHSHPFQHFPRITIHHLPVPADLSQESITCTPLGFPGRFVWL